MEALLALAKEVSEFISLHHVASKVIAIVIHIVREPNFFKALRSVGLGGKLLEVSKLIIN